MLTKPHFTKNEKQFDEEENYATRLANKTSNVANYDNFKQQNGASNVRLWKSQIGRETK